MNSIYNIFHKYLTEATIDRERTLILQFVLVVTSMYHRIEIRSVSRFFVLRAGRIY